MPLNYSLSQDLHVSPPFFSLNDPPTPQIYTLSLHDALPICRVERHLDPLAGPGVEEPAAWHRPVEVFLQEHPLRSEEHTSELQSLRHLVCRLLLEKKNKKNTMQRTYVTKQISSESKIV